MRTAILVALCLVASCPSMAEVHSCQPAVNAEISKYGVPPERVSEYIVVTESPPDSAAVGYKFWMRLKGCSSGYLVVDTDLVCNIEQTYTDGACLVSGIPSY